MDRSALEVYELEDEIPDGWYLHRFGVGRRMAICLQNVSLLGHRICNSRWVSNDHATIELRADGSWFIKDMKSEHGTYVNDKIVPEEGVVLEEWDVICLGRVRPRNAKEFGFMLKYKETSNSEKSCSIKTKSSSSFAPSTLKAPALENEDTSPNVSTESDRNSPISISDSRTDSDKSGNDSEKTVKNSSLVPVKTESSQDHINPGTHSDVPRLQETVSYKEKVSDWFSKYRQKSRTTRKSAKRKYVDADDNLSDSDSSSKTNPRGYQRDDNFVGCSSDQLSETERSCTGESDIELSKRNHIGKRKMKLKRLRRDSYYEDGSWNPKVRNYRRKQFN